MYYVSIKSQFKDLSIDLFIFNISKLTTVYRHATNMKIMFFTTHCLNVNISVTIKDNHLRFSVLILTIIRE